MGALGNGRRGGRTPSLLFAALIACVLLLGFNYWVSNSRNVELQAKLLELEERVRQVSAEREREQLSRSGAEEQVRRQTEKLALLEDSNHRQQQDAQNMWKLEKGKLLLNISSSAKTVQEMKNQMKALLEDLSKVHKELQSCQSNMNTLNKKLTYDMTQCNTQILAMKDECDEKVAAAKQGVQKKSPLPGDENHQPPPSAVGGTVVSTPKDAVPRLSSTGLKGNDSAKSGSELQNTEAPTGLKPRIRLETSKLLESENDLAIKDILIPSKPSSQNKTLNDVANEEDIEVLDIKGGDSRAAGLPVENGEEKDDDRAIEYDNEGEIEKRLSPPKDDNAAVQEFEEEVADYDGDEDNEPESEAEKQAELAEM